MVGREALMAAFEIPLPPLIGGRAGTAVGTAILAAILAWPIAYFSGLFPWIGYASLSRSSIGVGPGHFLIGENRAGVTLGPSSFFFFKGQKIVIAYDAEIRRGCLWLQVFHLWHAGPNPSVYRCVTESGTGEWQVPVTQTGIYDIIVHPTVVKGPGPGYEIGYTAWWGATW
jgi:hypothetical protein